METFNNDIIELNDKIKDEISAELVISGKENKVIV